MVNKDEIYNKIIGLLKNSNVEYRIFEHKKALSYQDLAEVQKEAGFVGTEGKCLILKVGDDFIVYITIQGKKVNFDAIKTSLQAKKVRLASSDELMENFSAEPGCAYPFGFDEKFDIYIDPKIYEQEWLLFSPLFPTQTVQAKSGDLKNLFANLENKVIETSAFNI